MVGGVQMRPANISAPVEDLPVWPEIRSRVVVLLAVLCLFTASTVGTAGAEGMTPSTTGYYYVSIGDSYAAGNQPTASAWAHNDTNGFAYQVVKLSRAKGYRLDLLNFGCGGATTTSVLQQVGCPVDNPGPDTTSYPGQTQVAAASRFISRHRGHIGLISVSIGGNDVLACDTAAQLLSCARSVLKVVKRNLAVFLAALRNSAGPEVPIVGTTYPDILLGSYLSPARESEEPGNTLGPRVPGPLQPHFAGGLHQRRRPLRRRDQSDGCLHAVQPDDGLWSLWGNS